MKKIVWKDNIYGYDTFADLPIMLAIEKRNEKYITWLDVQQIGMFDSQELAKKEGEKQFKELIRQLKKDYGDEEIQEVNNNVILDTNTKTKK